MKTGCIIQARTSSSRLPRKVLMPLPYGSDKSVLENIIGRVRLSEHIDDIVLATTMNRDDDAIEEISGKLNINLFRGDEANVLERFYLSAKKYKLDLIIRITGDCPCIDPKIIDYAINNHLKTGADFSSTGIKRSYPIGQDVGIFSFENLEKAYVSARFDYEKEHVTSYFYKTRPEAFKINIIKAPEKLFNPGLRLTLDTSEDYIFLCCVFDHLYEKDIYFGLTEILKLVKEKPWLTQINARVTQKKIFKNLKEELDEAIRYCELRSMSRVKKILETQKDQIEKSG